MTFPGIGVAMVSLAIAMGLASCTATAPATRPVSASTTQDSDRPGLKAVYSDLAASGGKVFALSPATSAVRIHAFRAGPGARLGHNHVLSAPRFTGFVYLPAGDVSIARFDLEFRLDQLDIDNPAHRSALGRAFASMLSPAAIEETRRHMLGNDNLQADRFPYVLIHSVQVSGEVPKLAARIRVELHGQQREMWLPITVEGLPDQLIATGSFVLRQTEFGVRPYSTAGGLLSVQDEVIIEFKLHGA